MSSNIIHLITPKTPAYIALGIEFGVRDSAGNLKPEIISSFLLSKILTKELLEEGKILSPNKHSIHYTLLTDRKLREKIEENGEAPAIISFQQRENGNFAVARLFETNRTKKKEGE